MKTKTKRSKSLRFVEEIMYKGKGKRSKELVSQAERLEKDAMMRKKNQRRHLKSIRD